MAKRMAFEEALKTNFRWPQKGDIPFQKSDDGYKNALLTKNVTIRTVVMMAGYKKAADLMVKQSMKDQNDRDFLVFPVLFNYRQFIELSLKYLLSNYGLKVGIDPIWNTHDFSRLWPAFSEMLKRYGTSDPDEADPVVAEIIAEFSKIDPQSFSNRYPVDTKGQPIPLSHDFLDLEVLADVMTATENYFTGTDGYLDSLKNAGP